MAPRYEDTIPAVRTTVLRDVHQGVISSGLRFSQYAPYDTMTAHEFGRRMAQAAREQARLELAETREKLALAEALLVDIYGDRDGGARVLRYSGAQIAAARERLEGREVVWVHDKTTGDLVLRLARKGDPEPWKTEDAR